MQDLLNAGQVLGRSEMKKIMAGSGSGDCEHEQLCYRVEDYPSVTKCKACVEVDLEECTAKCSSCCIV